MIKQIMIESHIGKAIVEAIKAETRTSTGRINLISIGILFAMDIVFGVRTVVETITNAVLTFFDKPTDHILPSWLVPMLIFITVAFLILCLFVVRDMELKKQSRRRSRRQDTKALVSKQVRV